MADETEKGEAAPEGPTVESLKAELDSAKAEHAKQMDAISRERDTAKQYAQTVMGQVKQMLESRGNETESVDFREKFNQDPEATLNEYFAKRVGPVYEEFLNTSAVSGRELARSKEIAKPDESWTKYEKEVDEFMGRMPADIRARPDSWDNALKYVRSQHLDDEVKERVSKRIEAEKKAAVEVAGPPAPARVARKSLSDEEKRIARALEIDEKDYLAMRDQMVVDPRGGGHLSGD